VPDRTVADFYIRYPDEVYLQQVVEFVDNAAKAAALSTGTKVKIDHYGKDVDGISLSTLAEVGFEYMKKLTEGEFTVDTVTEKGRTLFLWNGGNVRQITPSLFDRRHAFNLLVTYDLPLGKGKSWASGAFANKVLGGWTVSSIYTAASGLPLEVVDLNACSTEFGSTSFNGAPIGLIKTSSGAIDASRHNNPTTTNFGTNSSPGGVPNAFANPDAVVATFRYPTFDDKRLGLGAIRGMTRWNVDFAIAKRTNITERLSTRFDVQLVNAFNHPMFGSTTFFGFNNEPNTDKSDPQSFGVLSQQFNSPRYIQIGLRFDF